MALISNGNTKLGQIPNTSFPPGITCRPGAPCLTDGCYALKFYKMRPSARKAWDENWELYKENRETYWARLYAGFKMMRYFRYFVSGDIPDVGYAMEMINAALANPHCEFMCFTKQYEFMNEARARLEDERIAWPENLHVLYSGWAGLTPDNPYGFPETAVITPDMDEIPEDWKICGGNCTECACRGVGCWQVKMGETIAFHKH